MAETQFGVRYPDLSRVVRVASEEAARETANTCLGAVVVTRSVTEWQPLDSSQTTSSNSD